MEKTSTTDLAECSGCPDLGRCCYFQAIINDVAVHSSHSCPFLKDGLCSVYENRLEVAPWCGKVTNLEILWPTFCPHHNARGRDVMSAGEFYEINGALPHTEDAFRQLMEYINRTVEEQAHEEYGLDLRSFE